MQKRAQLLAQASVKGNHAAGASIKIVRHYRLAIQIGMKDVEADDVFFLRFLGP